jgi:very-short-patch-repair endonuclease
MAKKRLASKHMIDRARTLRKDSTPPEKLLWWALRNGRIAGLKFRRQHPIGPYVADFFCQSANLVIEVDGMSHDDKLEKDQQKTAYLQQQGLKVFRVMNEDVTRDLDAVVRGIAQVAGVKWD